MRHLISKAIVVLCAVYGVGLWASSIDARAAERDTRCTPRHLASLSNVCKAADDTYQCAKTIEAHQLKKNPTVIRRDALQLDLPLLDRTKTVVIQDSFDIKYNYIEYLGCLKHHLLHVKYSYHNEAYALVNANTGTLLHFRDLPHIAPDGRRFIARSMDPLPRYERNAIEIWRVKDTEIVQEWSLAPKEWGPGEPTWLDADTIRVDKFPLLDKARQLKTAELTIGRSDGTWEIMSEHRVPPAPMIDKAPPEVAVSSRITPAGGKVVLGGYVSAIFKAGAFDVPTNVTLRSTNDKDTAEAYDVSSWLVTAGPRLPYELRVRAGTIQPRKPVTLRLTVPSAFLERLAPGYTPYVSIRIDQGDMDHFEAFGTTFSEKASEAMVEIPPWAFTDSRPFSEGSFEAVLILGTVDMYAPAPVPVRELIPARVTITPAIRAKDLKFKLVGRGAPKSLSDGEIEYVAKGLLLLLNDCRQDTLHQPEQLRSEKFDWHTYLGEPHVLIEFNEPIEMPHKYTACDIKTQHGTRCEQRDETLRIKALLSTLQGPFRHATFPTLAIRNEAEDRFYVCGGNPLIISALMCTAAIMPNLPDTRFWQEICRVR